MIKLPINQKDLVAIAAVLLSYVEQHDPDCDCDLFEHVQKVLDKLDIYFSKDSRFSHLYKNH